MNSKDQETVGSVLVAEKVVGPSILAVIQPISCTIDSGNDKRDDDCAAESFIFASLERDILGSGPSSTTSASDEVERVNLSPRLRRSYLQELKQFQRYNNDSLLSDDDRSTYSSSSTIKEHIRRSFFPNIPALPSLQATSIDSDSGSTSRSKAVLQRSFAWSQDSSDDREQLNHKRIKQNPSTEDLTLTIQDFSGLSPRDNSPTCVHWEEKVNDIHDLTQVVHREQDFESGFHEG